MSANNFSPLVSIIIPAYNCENYIGATIETALNQTWQNKEIIIVDDGSTDNTLNIARQYENKYPNLKVYTQKNTGACNARKKGFAYCKGDLIQFLDGDDLMAPNKIQCQIEYLNGDLDCIVTCNWIKFRDSITDTIGSIEPYNTIKKNIIPLEWLLERHMMSPHAWLIPRRIVEQVDAKVSIGNFFKELAYNYYYPKYPV